MSARSQASGILDVKKESPRGRPAFAEAYQRIESILESGPFIPGTRAVHRAHPLQNEREDVERKPRPEQASLFDQRSHQLEEKAAPLFAEVRE